MMALLLGLACQEPAKNHSIPHDTDSPVDTAPVDVCLGQAYRMVDVGKTGLSCGVQESGCIKCWNVTFDPMSSLPVQIYTQIDVYKSPVWREGFDWKEVEPFLCVLNEAGELFCTDGIDTHGPNTSPVPTGIFTKISVGSFHVCGLQEDGTILCGGYDQTGETIVPEGKYIDVAALYLRTCALTDAGELVCWGEGSYWNNVGELVLDNGPFVALEGEYNEVCGLRADGFVQCTSNWVDDEDSVPPSVPLQQISLGYDFSLLWGVGLDAQGFAHPWPATADSNPVPLDVAFRQYAQGGAEGCGITLTGETHCYGNIDQPPP